MQLISVATAKELFEDFNHDALVAELKAATPYLNTIATPEEIKSLIVSVEAQSFGAVISALQSADADGSTFHSRIDINDIPDDMVADVDADLSEMVKSLELMQIYEMLEDNNYTGSDLENIAFIHADHFEEYVQDEATDNDWVAEHVIDCVNWSDYAHKMKMQYGSATIECPNLLNESSSEFFYSK